MVAQSGEWSLAEASERVAAEPKWEFESVVGLALMYKWGQRAVERLPTSTVVLPPARVLRFARSAERSVGQRAVRAETVYRCEDRDSTISGPEREPRLAASRLAEWESVPQFHSRNIFRQSSI